jgi:hypothetical protein
VKCQRELFLLSGHYPSQCDDVQLTRVPFVANPRLMVALRASKSYPFDGACSPRTAFTGCRARSAVFLLEIFHTADQAIATLFRRQRNHSPKIKTRIDQLRDKRHPSRLPTPPNTHTDPINTFDVNHTGWIDTGQCVYCTSPNSGFVDLI